MTKPADIISDLKARGLINQTTAGIEDHLTEARTLYCGFDPTADSLHIGSLVPLLTLRRFQHFGHRPVVLVGGATGMIGDPSFKAQERKLNDEATIQGWVEKLKTQTSRFVDFNGTPKALMANNYDWTKGVTVLEFLRDIGKHFSVNAMIAKDAVKSRLEREDVGISFTEFSYALLQAFDFHEMYRLPDFNCTVQIGGSDQWGNITAGTELIRKKLGGQAYALTLPLVTKADGTKFGKTESGTIWLDASKTSPYAFYQFWLNTADADVEKFLLYFSFMPVEKIKALCAEHAKEPHLRKAQIALAEDVTTLVHGADATKAAQRISQALFGGEINALTETDFAQLAASDLPKLNLSEPMPMPQALVSTGLADSNRQAREFLDGKAVLHNGEIVTDNCTLTPDNSLFGKYHLLRRGKKNYALLVHG